MNVYGFRPLHPLSCGHAHDLTSGLVLLYKQPELWPQRRRRGGGGGLRINVDVKNCEQQNNEVQK